jgi:hypothetical protein
MKAHTITFTAAEAAGLACEMIRLARELSAARLESANRLAAIRAALSAAADGEPDPLAYLRDQLAEESENTGTSRGRRC